MPIASETVPNRSLSAPEVRELLTRDFTRMLDGLSILQSCAAFGRVSWHLKLIIFNEQGVPTDIDLTSRAEAKNLIEHTPSLAAVESHPLSPVETEGEQLTAINRLARTLSRNVVSPNAERLREGLPVPVDIKQSDGTTRQETISYAPDPTMNEDVTELEKEA